MKFLTKFFTSLFLAALMIAILLTESISYAWLSSSWNGGEFELTTANTNTPLFELWTFHDDDKWYNTYTGDDVDDGETVPEDKLIPGINAETENPSTYFTPDETDGNLALYFGTINNLVQEQENQPVYLKFTLTLPHNSTNKLLINYSLPGNYVRPYLVDLSDSDQTGTLVTDSDANKNLFTELNKRSFLELYYCVKETELDDEGNITTDYNYVISSEGTLSSDFTALFADTNSNLLTYKKDASVNSYYDSTENQIVHELTNATKYEKTVYVYFKFSVPTEALQEALLNTELKSNMPMYLIFDTNFSLEIRSESRPESTT